MPSLHREHPAYARVNQASWFDEEDIGRFRFLLGWAMYLTCVSRFGWPCRLRAYSREHHPYLSVLGAGTTGLFASQILSMVTDNVQGSSFEREK